MIRVTIADDHDLVRAGIRRLLTDATDITVVAEAHRGDIVGATLEQTPTDVLILDVAMPGARFLELLRDLRARHPQVRVVVLTAQPESEYAVRALRAGAHGFVTKDRTPEELVAAIRKAHSGRRYVSERLAELLASHVGGDGGPDHADLSDREYEVLQQLGAGRSVKEIAALLHVSPKTVSTYRARTLEKLHLKTTADLIRYAVQHGLTGDDT